jgi:hypothetical protein
MPQQETIRFLGNFRAKYPQYDDLDDAVLLESIQRKWPQYSDLTLDPIEPPPAQEPPPTAPAPPLTQPPAVAPPPPVEEPPREHDLRFTQTERPPLLRSQPGSLMDSSGETPVEPQPPPPPAGGDAMGEQGLGFGGVSPTGEQVGVPFVEDEEGRWGALPTAGRPPTPTPTAAPSDSALRAESQAQALPAFLRYAKEIEALGGAVKAGVIQPGASKAERKTAKDALRRLGEEVSAIYPPLVEPESDRPPFASLSPAEQEAEGRASLDAFNREFPQTPYDPPPEERRLKGPLPPPEDAQPTPTPPRIKRTPGGGVWSPNGSREPTLTRRRERWPSSSYGYSSSGQASGRRRYGTIPCYASKHRILADPHRSG